LLGSRKDGVDRRTERRRDKNGEYQQQLGLEAVHQR
jgi:hypothetical protein